MKKANVKLHHGWKHAAKPDVFQEQMCLDNVEAARRTLDAQPAAFNGLHSDRDNVMQSSFAVSEQIAKKLKLHLEGEFVKKCTKLN